MAEAGAEAGACALGIALREHMRRSLMLSTRRAAIMMPSKNFEGSGQVQGRG